MEVSWKTNGKVLEMKEETSWVFNFLSLLIYWSSVFPSISKIPHTPLTEKKSPKTRGENSVLPLSRVHVGTLYFCLGFTSCEVWLQVSFSLWWPRDFWTIVSKSSSVWSCKSKELSLLWENDDILLLRWNSPNEQRRRMVSHQVSGDNSAETTGADSSDWRKSGSFPEAKSA